MRQLDALSRFASTRPMPALPAPDAPVLVVASGKGGTGTSLVSALLALALAEDGRRTLLVEAVPGFGALPLLLGVRPTYGVHSLLLGVDAAHALLPVAGSLALLAGTGETHADAPAATIAEWGSALRRASSLYGEFDVVVVDAGSRADVVSAACTAGVSSLLAVTTRDPIALAATHALVKTLAPLVGAPAIVANRCDEPEGMIVHQHLLHAADRFLGHPVEFAGAIPADQCLAGGLAGGMSVQDAAGGSPAAVAARAIGLGMLHTVALRLAGASPPPDAPAPFALARN